MTGIAEPKSEPDGGNLAGRSCVPCHAGARALRPEEAAGLVAQLKNWEIEDGRQIKKLVKFPDFRSALAFVNKVGEVAEAEGHHPDISLGWGRVEITLWTHAAGGLTENDFILAAKIDRL